MTVDGATSGDGITILPGEPITWRYTVTNVGSGRLNNVTVTDTEAGVTPAYVSGDSNGDGMLEPTETWIFEAPGTAITGPYSNTGTASCLGRRLRRPHAHHRQPATALTTSESRRRSPSTR